VRWGRDVNPGARSTLQPPVQDQPHHILKNHAFGEGKMKQINNFTVSKFRSSRTWEFHRKMETLRCYGFCDRSYV